MTKINSKNNFLMEYNNLNGIRDFITEQMNNFGIEDYVQQDALRLTADYVRTNLIVICKWDKNIDNTNTNNKNDLGLDAVRYYHNECKNLIKSVNQKLMLKPYVFFTEEHQNLDEIYKDKAYKVKVPDLPQEIKKCGFNYIPYILNKTKQAYKTSHCNNTILTDSGLPFIHNKRFALYLDLDIELVNIPDEYLYMISDKIISPINIIINKGNGNERVKSLIDINKEGYKYNPKVITYGFDQKKEKDQLINRPNICDVYSNTCVTLCDLETNFAQDWFKNLQKMITPKNCNNTNLEEISFDKTCNEANHDILYLYHTQIGDNYLHPEELSGGFTNNFDIINFHGPEFSNKNDLSDTYKNKLVEEVYIASEMSKLRYKLDKKNENRQLKKTNK